MSVSCNLTSSSQLSGSKIENPLWWGACTFDVHRLIARPRACSEGVQTAFIIIETPLAKNNIIKASESPAVLHPMLLLMVSCSAVFSTCWCFLFLWMTNAPAPQSARTLPNSPNPGQTDAQIKGSDPSRAVLHPASAPLESGRNHKKGREGHDSWRGLWSFSPRVPKKRCEQEEMDSSELINAVIWKDQQGVGIRCRSLLFTKQRCNKSVTWLKQTHGGFC